jgi:hypothetical protein
MSVASMAVAPSVAALSAAASSAGAAVLPPLSHQCNVPPYLSKYSLITRLCRTSFISQSVSLSLRRAVPPYVLSVLLSLRCASLPFNLFRYLSIEL